MTGSPQADASGRDRDDFGIVQALTIANLKARHAKNTPTLPQENGGVSESAVRELFSSADRQLNGNGASGARQVLLPFGIEVDTFALVTGMLGVPQGGALATLPD